MQEKLNYLTAYFCGYGKAVHVNAVKSYCCVEVQFHRLLVLALDGDGWSPSPPDTLFLRKESRIRIEYEAGLNMVMTDINCT